MKIAISSRNSCRGVALMIVMLVVFVLTSMVAWFALKMKVEVQLAKNDNNEAQVEWVARGAIEWAKYAISVKCANMQGVDALGEAWAGGGGCQDDPLLTTIDLNNIEFTSGSGAVMGKASVKITDCERKWNINLLANPRAPQPWLIINALGVMGVTDIGEESKISDCILDWVNPTQKSRFDGAKEDYYSHLVPPMHCKNGYIDDISEMVRIKNILPEMVSATNFSLSAYQRSLNPRDKNLQPVSYDYHFDELFTVYGGKLNANTASREALMLIPGIDSELADKIVSARCGEDGMIGTDDDMPYRSTAEVLTRGLAGAPIGGGVPVIPPAGLLEGVGVAGSREVQGGTLGVAGMASAAQRFLGVSSQYFEVTVEASVADYHRTYFAVIHRRQGRDPEIIKFYAN